MENKTLKTEQVESNFQEYLSLWRTVKRDGIEDLIQFLEKSDMKVAPASTRFHSNYAGGLVEHSLNVYRALCNKKEGKSTWGDVFDQVSEEALVITALGHDLCKLYFYQPSTRNVKNEETGKWEKVPSYNIDDKYPLGHGSKSVIFLQMFLKLTMEEIMAINWHMGFSVPKEEYSSLGKAFEKYPLALALHQADMEATYLME